MEAWEIIIIVILSILIIGLVVYIIFYVSRVKQQFKINESTFDEDKKKLEKYQKIIKQCDEKYVEEVKRVARLKATEDIEKKEYNEVLKSAEKRLNMTEGDEDIKAEELEGLLEAIKKSPEKEQKNLLETTSTTPTDNVPENPRLMRDKT